MAHSIISDTEELPIAAHIFEGYLYIKDDNTNKWLWRLFRFDGTSLTCLSSKKNKLPPHTLLDKPSNSNSASSHHYPASLLTHSASTHSFTSPILATPKHRKDRIQAGTSSILEAVPFDHNSKRNSQPISASYYQLPKWTIDMINISSISLLKPKQRKSKSLKYSFAAPVSKSKSFTIRTYDGACYVLKANKQHDLERWIFVLAKMWKFAQAARQMYGGPIVPQLNRSSTLPAIASGATNKNLASIHSPNDQMTSPNQINQLAMKALMANHVGQHQQQQHSNHYQESMLSNEKALWIEKWVKSLAELETHTPTESYNDLVDIVSIPTHITASTRSSSRHHQHETIDNVQSLQPHQSSKYSSNQSLNYVKIKAKKCETRYNSDYMNYFQDANTIYTDETSQSIRVDTMPSLKYHNSVSARPIKSHTTEHDIPMPISAAILAHSPQALEHGCSPLDMLEYKCTQDRLLPSPPTTPAAAVAAALESDEDVCLADVRKSLQSMEINKMQAEQELLAKRRSATMMVNASRRGDVETNEWYRSDSWAPSTSSKGRSNRLFSTAFT